MSLCGKTSRYRARWGAALGPLLVSVCAMAADLPPFPAPPAPLVEIAQLQRFLALATRPGTNEPPIRVLFYGQSIIDQWWSRLAEVLRRRFPDRPWLFENRALGGHAAPYLLKTAEADVYRFQPDLLVFHDYDVDGRWDHYAEFIRRVRQRTCADILIVGNHLAGWDVLDEDSRTNGLPVELWPGHAAVDYVYLPAIADSVGACRADIRTPWKRYLREHALDPAVLRADHVHLNAAGVEFVVTLLAAYVEPRVFTPAVDPFDCGRVSRIRIEGRRELTFTGNRIVLAATGGPARVACLLDGQPPSRWPVLYQHGRASAWPQTWLPALLKIESASVPIEEDWALTVDEIPDERAFTFHLRGSVTGADGHGRADADFTSASGRVQIRSADWYWEAFQGGLTPGFQIRWQTRLHGSDHAEAGGAWHWVEVANGLEDGPHTLRLERLAGRLEDFPEVLVYHPAGAEVGAGPDRTMRWIAEKGGLLIRWPDLPDGSPAVSSDLNRWQPLPAAPARFGRRQIELATEAAAAFYTLLPTIKP